MDAGVKTKASFSHVRIPQPAKSSAVLHGCRRFMIRAVCLLGGLDGIMPTKHETKHETTLLGEI